MADSDQYKSTPTLTARDQEIAIQALLNLKSGEDLQVSHRQPRHSHIYHGLILTHQVDNAALASALGLKNAASAATCWCNVKKKLLAVKNSTANTGGPGAFSVIQTKPKTTRAKPAPRSKKSAISEAAVEQSNDPGENDHAEGTSPSGKGCFPDRRVDDLTDHLSLHSNRTTSYHYHPSPSSCHQEASSQDQGREGSRGSRSSGNSRRRSERPSGAG